MPSLAQHQSNRLLGREIIINENGCWLWQGPKTTQGYGRYKNTTAHNAVWRAAYGELKRGQIVCHKCFVKTCVNPDHLYAGTHKQNHQDVDMRKVHTRVRKLDKLDYKAIEILYSQGWLKTEIGRLVGVSGEHIGKFLRGGLKYAKPSTTSK